MYCKNCCKIIEDDCTFCPHCGQNQQGNVKKKNGTGRKVFGIILCVFGVFMVIGALGSTVNNEQRKVGTSDIYIEDAAPTEEKFEVGDIVELNSIQVTLKSVKESTGGQFFYPDAGNVFLICEFNIENNSSSDVAVSSLMCFETYIDDYAVNMDLYATTSSGKNQLDGTVASGKKMNGVIGYQAPSNWSEIEIRFTPDFWANSDIIFTYKK